MTYVIMTAVCVAMALINVPGMLEGDGWSAVSFGGCAICALVCAGLGIDIALRR